MTDRDPFWDNEANVEAAKWSWPRAFASAAFWAAVCVIVYIAVRYG